VQGTALGGTDSNVQITSATNGNILTYDGGNGYWKNTDLTAGTAISVAKSANGVLTVNNTGVTSAVAGTGISVSGATGAVTVTNTAPDQTVAIASGTGISVTGTYPSFTVTNTLPSLGGTVTSVSGTTGRITSTGGNTPVIDLASGVATAGTTGSSSLIPVVTIDTYGRVTGITTAANPQGTVTSVTGTSPVVSSGGATPAISMPAATGSVNGYLTSTDWTTFNNKGSGSVTSVAQSFTGGIVSVAGSPITSSGTLALTVAGTSGGIPYFSSGTTWASSAALTQYGVVYGGGAGAAPVATAAGTTGQVLTATTGGAPTWATPSASLTVTNDTSTASALYPTFTSSTGTAITGLSVTSTKLTFVPTTGSLTAPQVVASNGIVVNNRTIGTTFSIPSGYSATSAGPITISTGVTVTVPTGGKWVVL
jgi:hypothetical protein